MNPNKVALVVGINDYPNTPLESCVHDAIEVGAFLSMKEYGFTVTTLLNQDASRRAVKEHLDQLLRCNADSFLFYFSGHGWATDVGVYLVTPDADEIEHGVDLEWLKRAITKLTPTTSTVTVILDCCHSGAATARHLGESGVRMRAEDVAMAIPSMASGRVVLAACKEDQVAYEESSQGHGIFTAHLIDGLMGEAADADGAITVTGLFGYIAMNLQRGGMQTPVFRGDFAGRLLLGTGFTGRTPAGLGEEEAAEIEREGQRHLSDYQSRFAESYTDLEVWQQSGYKTACQMLEPILLWFNKRLKEFPALAKRKRFSELRDAASQRLEPLCAVDVGTVLTEGVIRQKLGSGLFGTVWRVVRPALQSDLALKIYHPQDIDEAEKVRRFRRGYEAMKQLDHPHIVKVYRFAECPLGFYMDYIDGPNMRKFSGTVDDPSTLLTILLAVAETLQHAHLRGVVHRDVKPENILMSYDQATAHWRPYLTDFDLAWFSTATQVTKQEGIGTWQYSAPEQMRSPKSAGAHAPTADSYAFGQLSFFVMTGSDPVPLDEANNKRTLANRIRSGWLLRSAELFTDLYDRCTQRQPDKRPGFVEICKDLFTVSLLLKDVDGSSTLSEERFIGDLVFSIVGLSPDHKFQDGSFLTLSRKTRVTISVLSRKGKNVELLYDFRSESSPVLHGISSHDKMRAAIMGKVEAALTSIAGTSIKAGSQPPFQVKVRHDQVPLSLDGLNEARSLIGLASRAIEG